MKKIIGDFKKLVLLAEKNEFYSDINFFSKGESRINLDKTNTEIGKDNDAGVKIRIWDGEKYLEYAQSSLEFESLKEKMSELISQAKKNKKGNNENKDLLVSKEKLEKDYKSKLKISGENISLEEKCEKLHSFKNKILKISKEIVNARVVLIEEIEKNIFVNPYKALSQEIPIVIMAIVAYVQSKDGNVRTVFKSFVDNDLNVFNKAKNQFEEFEKNIENIKDAKKLKGGKYKVLLSPSLTGLLAHESFGHGMEADTMMRGRALASNWIGKRIGKSNVNIVDYPNVAGKHGEFYFDHEGNPARKTFLVKEGIINEPMSDLYSKTQLGLKHSSNSRFESFDHKHYTRMSNTFFEAGDENYKDLIAKVDDGIFIQSSSGGMEDPKGWGVQIQGNFGQRIKNGKLINEFYDGFALTGFLPDIVKNISGISKEFEIEGGGHCGKGHKEWVRVSEGGPYLLIDEVILG
ncbi:MAG: TldD/PmbA family protein [Nanoarchaeota archaeon]|nr:TldD/PmbA family protein [Nanoarchaeota archaeon]